MLLNQTTWYKFFLTWFTKVWIQRKFTHVKKFHFTFFDKNISGGTYQIFSWLPHTKIWKSEILFFLHEIFLSLRTKKSPKKFFAKKKYGKNNFSMFWKNLKNIQFFHDLVRRTMAYNTHIISTNHCWQNKISDNQYWSSALIRADNCWHISSRQRWPYFRAVQKRDILAISGHQHWQPISADESVLMTADSIISSHKYWSLLITTDDDISSHQHWSVLIADKPLSSSVLTSADDHW